MTERERERERERGEKDDDANRQTDFYGWIPGLVVMGEDSCSNWCGFESRRCILDGHDIFSH